MLRWLADYWYVPLLAAGAVVGWVLLGRFRSKTDPPPLQDVLAEVAAIKAKRETREVELRLGAERARQHVREKYRAKLGRLDAEAALKVKELENDSAALAAYLDRLADPDRG